MFDRLRSIMTTPSPLRISSARLPWAFGLLALLVVLAPACDDDDDRICPTCPGRADDPAAPRGLYSITGDAEVTLVWYANTEADLESYAIYRSESYDGEYDLIGEIDACESCYQEEVTVEAANGVRWFYAVVAIDRYGNESELSLEEVSDTSRPQGHASISNSLVDVEGAGFDLSRAEVVDADAERADFFYSFDELGGFITAGSLTANATGIQDMGFTADFDEIGAAPVEGWSPVQQVEAIEGHTYVLWTRDDHYAKIRATDVAQQQITFQWAYQTQAGNTELKRPLEP